MKPIYGTTALEEKGRLEKEGKVTYNNYSYYYYVLCIMYYVFIMYYVCEKAYPICRAGSLGGASFFNGVDQSVDESSSILQSHFLINTCKI